MPRKRNKRNQEKEPKAIREMKKNKKREENKPKRKKKFKFIILIILIILILILGISLGVSAHTWKTLAKDMIYNENSVVIDTDGNTIAELGSEKKKIPLASSEIPAKLKNAYVAIEDERFYSHSGIDIKRTASAIASYIIHFGSSSFGGSTITQQLVKNLTGDSTDSVTRKVKEWWKAWQLETCLSKDEILTGYLNVIYVGPSIYGVEAGAKYYFNKSAKDLKLEECAFLAGLNHSPNSYNPFTNDDNSEKIKNRTKTVLAKMQELGYIESEEEYNQAVSNVEKGLNFKKGEVKSGNGVYSYHTDALITEITQDIQNKYNISETFATNYITMAGLTIHSTQDSKVQEITETEFEKTKYVRASKNGGDPSQAAMVVVDQNTGYVTACTGGLGKKTTSRPFNRATQSVRQTGSAIKPIAVLAPAIDKKIITAASIYDDTEKDFEKGYHPVDYSKSLGKITVRRAVESSQNIPFVEIMEEIKPRNAIKYLEKMGVTSLTEKDRGLPLALGGLEKGISPLEMAGAYATIANDGVYIEPTFYSRINRENGEEVIKSKQKKKKVFSKEVAYILKNILTQPVLGENGTATYCKISGVDVAAKTGTTDENYDRWLCGFTPYYTAVTWYGYDQNESVQFNQRNPAGLLWANVMARVHTGLESKKFEKPSTVLSATICAETGMRATTACKNTYTEYFLWFTTPDLCTKHLGEELTTKEDTNDTTNNTKEIVKGITEDIDATEPPRTTKPVERNNNIETENNQNKDKNKNTSNTNTNTSNDNNKTNSNTNNGTNTSNNTTNSTNNNTNNETTNNSSNTSDNTSNTTENQTNNNTDEN